MKKIIIGLLKLVHVVDTENNDFNGFLATGFKDFIENEDTGFIFSKIRRIIIDDKSTEQLLLLEYTTNGFSLIENKKKKNFVFNTETKSKSDTVIVFTATDKETLKTLDIEALSSGTILIRPVRLSSSLLCYHNVKQQKLNCKLQ